MPYFIDLSTIGLVLPSLNDFNLGYTYLMRKRRSRRSVMASFCILKFSFSSCLCGFC
jgi:hypothetical protein